MDALEYTAKRLIALGTFSPNATVESVVVVLQAEQSRLARKLDLLYLEGFARAAKDIRFSCVTTKRSSFRLPFSCKARIVESAYSQRFHLQYERGFIDGVLSALGEAL